MTRLWLDKHIDKLYFWCFALLAVSLPISPFITSISQFLLSIVWLIEGKYLSKIKCFLNNKLAVILSSIFLVHLVWLINTSNWNYALNDIKIKLPILILIFIGGSKSNLFTIKELEYILKYFIISVFFATLISIGNFFHWFGFQYTDIRAISSIISHIRFALYIVLSIFFLIYFLFSKRQLLKPLEKLLYISIFFWFVFFLILIRSLTGLVIFTIISITYLTYFIIKIKSEPWLKYLALLLLVFLIIFPTYLLISTFNLYYSNTKPNYYTLDKKTINGNSYSFRENNDEIENGNYVWVYVCMKELENEWNKRSPYKFVGNDKKGQPIRFTIIRYITSKGLRKDSVGLSNLSNKDITNIEDGYTNYILAKKISLRARIYVTIWEIDNYMTTGNANYCSVAQRWEYLKAAKVIISQNFWFGTGTGDVQDAYDTYYRESHSKLVEKRWKRAHNQFVTFIVSFGIFGFIIVLFAFISPFIIGKSKPSVYFITYYLIFLLSMLNEDTLETQAGVTFFAYFITLFLFVTNNDDKLKIKIKI